MAKICTPKFASGPVNAGEERLLKFLEVKLPDNYFLIPNGEYPSMNPQGAVQYWEYDCIVVAPHAIYTIENKDYRGRRRLMTIRGSAMTLRNLTQSSRQPLRANCSQAT